MNYDLTGKRFFKLTVIAREGTEAATGLPIWRCRCVCGREHTTTTSPISRRCITLIRCPCMTKPKRRRHVIRHGGSSSREYAEWRALRKRCGTSTAKRRAITLEPRWAVSFDAFRRDVGPCPAPNARLIRIDAGKGWEPGNTRWVVSPKPRRRANARTIAAGGKAASLAAWSRAMMIEPGTLWWRVKAGWPVQKALRAPVREYTRYQ
jgi:hypothetical protein